MRTLPILAASLLSLSSVSAPALEIRGYQAERHDRMFGPERRPPEMNPDFKPDAALFRGVGGPDFASGEWHRQVALVSPRHFVCAAHYEWNPAWPLVFSGSDGKLHTYQVISTAVVMNPQSRKTDLMIGTLATAVEAAGVTPFPVPERMEEEKSTGLPLLVFGKAYRGAMTRIDGFTTLKDDPGFDTTRFAFFDFTKNAGPCNYEGGDSGCPAFVMAGGKPVLVGTASGQDALPGGISRNYLNFIPAYLNELDAMMEPQGHHLMRIHPASAGLEITAAPDGPWIAGNKGRLSIKSGNPGPAVAHNLSLEIVFPTAPSAVTGEGWICEAVSPVIWKCRRGGLRAAARSTITATWENLPATSMELRILKNYDGGKPLSVILKTPVTARSPTAISPSAPAGSPP